MSSLSLVLPYRTFFRLLLLLVLKMFFPRFRRFDNLRLHGLGKKAISISSSLCLMISQLDREDMDDCSQPALIRRISSKIYVLELITQYALLLG